ncbi:hypothetical protein G3I70_34260 [Actinomadura bangladeshensis]|uniref:Uncharacterized protein n=2 Tax=Actinomadura bangladeshensis TaxID=453573 RepID=A0A6L9QU77_9ACTN|nr:hypothetical protein [Actinomadura bangladeshensis]
MTFEPGRPVLYMKVGTHARETLGDIIERKRREIENEGFAMWGYGGNTCHPLKMVQPFAKAANAPITLCMQPMQSKHFADPIRAEEYSEDGKIWRPVPEGINVRGSNYALCIDSLEEVDETLDLSGTRVAVGPSRGRIGNAYIRGRVDKACLEVADNDIEVSKKVSIRLTAEIIAPYAVLLRS